MSADDLVHESGLARPRASDIETASLNSGGHDTKADSDLRTQSEIYPVNIEAVAQLARFYANGTPPDEEFRLIKEWINTPCNVDKQKGAHLTPKEWRAAQETLVARSNVRAAHRRRCIQPADRNNSGKVRLFC